MTSGCRRSGEAGSSGSCSNTSSPAPDQTTFGERGLFHNLTGLLAERHAEKKILAAAQQFPQTLRSTDPFHPKRFGVAQLGIVAPIIGVRSVARLNDIIDVGRLGLDKRQLDVLSAARAP